MSSVDAPPERCDIAVVGAGILGLAAARELGRRHPGRRIVVLDKEHEIARHQTGRNSGVIHAGIYYAPGSLKARLCREGARALYAFCERHEIAAERCGKLIVAVDASELAGLDELERRGRANGVPGLRRLDAHQLTELEPCATGVAALHSPATGIVDFRAVARALRSDLEASGGRVGLGCEVTRVDTQRRRVRIVHGRGELDAGHALVCAGAWSDRLAVAAGAPAEPRIVPFRGAYMRLRPERRSLVRALIYPVPDPRLPFLGIHLTRHVDGDVLLGPTALMAPARDAYRLRDVRARDVLSTLSWPGTPRLMRRFWRTGVQEIVHAVSPRAIAAAAARYVPQLRADDLLPAWAGVRAQALARDGRLVDDFTFSVTDRALHVRNAPSPAATAALAIAQHVAHRAEEAFALR